jgi:hypothetical protein
MVQIGFLTFLFGVISGIHPVEVSVAGPVAAIELQLDGVPVGRLTSPPWKWQVDLDQDLLPHELTARALDAGGAEVGRTRQWVNLPRPQADVTFVLEGDDLTRPSGVRLAWQTLVALPPPRLSLTLDGRRLAVDRKGRAALPPLDPAVPRVLSAELDFGPGIETRRDLVFSAEGSETFTELTAIPVRGALPEPRGMQGWFRSNGTPLHPLAVEDEGDQVVIVADIRAHLLLRPVVGQLKRKEGLGMGRGLRLLSTMPVRKAGASGGDVDLFDYFYFTDSQRHRELQVLVHQLDGWDAVWSRRRQRLADAVAVAGLKASAGNRPRAVVLVLGPDPIDESQHDPTMVRRYLAALRVPLHVWSAVPPAESKVAVRWGEAENVSSRDGLAQAIERLHADLASQRIVFFEGLHLPQTIQLTDAAAPGVELP